MQKLSINQKKKKKTPLLLSAGHAKTAAKCQIHNTEMFCYCKEPLRTNLEMQLMRQHVCWNKQIFIHNHWLSFHLHLEIYSLSLTLLLLLTTFMHRCRVIEADMDQISIAIALGARYKDIFPAGDYIVYSILHPGVKLFILSERSQVAHLADDY